MNKKERLDKVLQNKYPHYSRNIIQSFIMQGKVSVNDTIETKSGTLIHEDAHIVVIDDTPKYVCRAGFKLEKALAHFAIDVTNNIAVDSGLSTGGFTDCLLQNGAKHVYGIDVGYGQVHEKIRSDPRVTVMEKINFRYVTNIENTTNFADIITIDLSFISVLKVLNAIKSLLKKQGKLIVLIKPQFEADRIHVNKGNGIITDEKVHQYVIDKITQGIKNEDFSLIGYIESPILGTSGNKEFLAYFIQN